MVTETGYLRCVRAILAASARAPRSASARADVPACSTHPSAHNDQFVYCANRDSNSNIYYQLSHDFSPRVVGDQHFDARCVQLIHGGAHPTEPPWHRLEQIELAAVIRADVGVCI